MARKLLSQVSTSLVPSAVLEGFSPPQDAATQWSELLNLLQRLCSTLAGWPAELDAVRNWYVPFLGVSCEDPRVGLADLEQLRLIAASFSSRAEFLTESALDPPGSANEEAIDPHLGKDRVTLSTIHSAKGLEWTTVFVLNVVDGCIPSRLGTGMADIEEERRLMYVAMTRAKDELHIVQPRSLFARRHQLAFCARAGTIARTSFIPTELLAHFEQRSWPEVNTLRPPRGLQARGANT